MARLRQRSPWEGIVRGAQAGFVGGALMTIDRPGAMHEHALESAPGAAADVVTVALAGAVIGVAVVLASRCWDWMQRRK